MESVLTGVTTGPKSPDVVKTQSISATTSVRFRSTSTVSDLPVEGLEGLSSSLVASARQCDIISMLNVPVGETSPSWERETWLCHLACSEASQSVSRHVRERVPPEISTLPHHETNKVSTTITSPSSRHPVAALVSP